MFEEVVIEVDTFLLPSRSVTKQFYSSHRPSTGQKKKTERINKPIDSRRAFWEPTHPKREASGFGYNGQSNI